MLWKTNEINSEILYLTLDLFCFGKMEKNKEAKL